VLTAVHVPHHHHQPTHTVLQAGREFMGRAAVPLTQYISEEGLEDEFVLPLGKGDWTNLEGPVSVTLGTQCNLHRHTCV
jgi:hypothetical protein